MAAKIPLLSLHCCMLAIRETMDPDNKISVTKINAHQPISTLSKLPKSFD